MRLVTQGIVAGALFALGAAGWYAWQNPTIVHTVQAQIGGGPSPAGAVRANAPGQPPGGGRRGGGAAATVVVAPVETAPIIETIESTGTALANESLVITAKQTGVVTKLNFTEGQRIAEGATLVEFDAKERRADLETAVALRDEAAQRLDRARRMQAGTIAAARLDEYEAQARAAEARVRSAQARREDNSITAPFAGRVGLRQVSLGALVQPGTTITTLDDISRIKAEFSVPETALGGLRRGLPVRAKTPAFGDRVFVGTVAVIDTRVDAVTRSVRVHALIDNADELLRPGLFFNVELTLGRREDAKLVPEEAIVADGNDHYLFAVVDGRAQRRKVTVGTRIPGKVEIVNGAALGESIVVRGVQKIRDGQPVAVGAPAATPPAPAAPPGRGSLNGAAAGPRSS
jgi:membrane fusion protein (multidrug efflux system)